MVTFLTLFLGLTLGARPVAVDVGKDVASVELRLDGRLVGVLKNAPWRQDVDFGSIPEPHFLEARGLDANGVELDKVLQKINLSRSLAEASLFLQPGKGGDGRVARLTFRSAIAERPERVRVSLDGSPIAAPDPERIEIPAFVPERIHFLRADLEFPSAVSASAEISFGGGNRDRTQAELTAVPVLPERRKLPPENEMDGWFLAGGAPARVVAQEEGQGEIEVVLDEAARLPLAQLVESYRSISILAGASPSRLARDVAPLKSGQRVRFQWAFPMVHEHSGVRFDVFPRSQDYPAGTSGLLWMLTHAFPPVRPETVRLADAVAVAALDVSAESRPRAIVLLLAGSKDESLLGASAARAFLERLGVPLFVWTLGAGGASEAAAWGDVNALADVSKPAAFEDAARKLIRFVDRERIVWLEGLHLPQAITLSSRAAGVTLAR